MNVLLSSHRLCTLFGIEVRIAYSLYLLAVLLALPAIAHAPGDAAALLLLPIWIVMHELGHSLAARSYGLQVDGITLHMLGGAALTRGQVPGPLAEIVIAAAGPAVTMLLALAGLGGGLWLGGMAGSFAQAVFFINLALLIFNLLPVFPLDGGRIAQAALVLRMGEERAVRLMTPVSRVGMVLIAAYGFYEMLNGRFFGLMLVMFAFLLYVQGGQEMQGRMYLRRYSRGGGWDAEDDLYARQAGWRGGGGMYAPSSRGDADRVGATMPDGDCPPKKEGTFGRWWRQRREKKAARAQAEAQELNRRVDAVLAKVKSEGISALTPEEKSLLQHASRQYRKS